MRPLRLAGAMLAIVAAAGCATSATSSPTSDDGPPRSPAFDAPSSTSAPAPEDAAASAEAIGSDEPSDEPEPVFRGRITRIGTDLRPLILERNWDRGCPVPLRDLRVLHAEYRGFDGAVHTGPLVLNERVVRDVRTVFARLFRTGFEIHHIALARKYRPNVHRYDDTRDVTASFNCRPVTDGTSLSQHSYGWAIDINPLENPYVRGDGSVLRRAAKPFRDRDQNAPGMIKAGGVVVRAFARIGWEWGGYWSSIKDYMHFSFTGR